MFGTSLWNELVGTETNLNNTIIYVIEADILLGSFSIKKRPNFLFQFLCDIVFTHRGHTPIIIELLHPIYENGELFFVEQAVTIDIRLLKCLHHLSHALSHNCLILRRFFIQTDFFFVLYGKSREPFNSKPAYIIQVLRHFLFFILNLLIILFTLIKY